jgi:hypothetical protein
MILKHSIFLLNCVPPRKPQIKIMKKPFIVILALVLSFSLEGQKTEIQYLSGTDKDNTVAWDFFCTHGMNSGKWSRIEVPSNWELQGFGTYLYGNVNRKADEKGMYKYEFTVPASWKKKKVNIVFEGSMTDTEVKINGKSAGPVHQGAFYRFKHDITGMLNHGAANLLEVTVSKESSNESVNRAERISDYWVFGGIFRPVYLEALPLQYIDRVAIDARADGSFYMDVFTGGKGGARTVSAQLMTLDGKTFGDPVIATISKDSSRKAVIKAAFPGAALWNPEFPNRYQVEVTLMQGKKPVHSHTQKFGFRTVELKPEDGIYVNGTKIMFKGVCRHTFWPSSGRTSSRQLAIEDVNLMKDMNMNAVRMSHYPPDIFFLDVCDSLGMFVLDEIAGWQKFYDTPTAKRLVRQVVERDVNHPSVVLWDNGNEGGFNVDIRNDYAKYDPQKRTVIEPWGIINGTNTKHYPRFDYVQNALNNGKEIFFPTEFLHGLNDGGHGAGLDDQWNFMLSKPLSAGAFLWVFADEGVERRDRNDSIDADGNRGPDGILGPYHEKEGSFYTVKEIWSPVYFSQAEIGPDFRGQIPVSNRYLYTNLKSCKFSYSLVRYSFPDGVSGMNEGNISAPDVSPGKEGLLQLDLPPDWKEYDALYISATDQYGRNINTWSWKLTRPRDFAERIVLSDQRLINASESKNTLTIRSAALEINFDRTTGVMTSLKNLNIDTHVKMENPFAGMTRRFRDMRHYRKDDSYVVEVKYDSASYITWTILRGGWVRLDYGYQLNGNYDFAGISFSYPEERVSGATLLGDGPYRVWKNRIKGTNFALFKKNYNNTMTGQSWEYPEFKGYYSGLYAVEIQTLDIPLTIVAASDDLFLHLFTPATSTNLNGVRGGMKPPFPVGNLSVLHGITPIGTKFSRADQEGPQGSRNQFRGMYEGTIYIRYGE